MLEWMRFYYWVRFEVKRFGRGDPQGCIRNLFQFLYHVVDKIPITWIIAVKLAQIRRIPLASEKRARRKQNPREL
jgi:hypothetical protein